MTSIYITSHDLVYSAVAPCAQHANFKEFLSISCRVHGDYALASDGGRNSSVGGGGRGKGLEMGLREGQRSWKGE